MRFNRVAVLYFFLLSFLGNAPESISQVCNLSQIPSNLRSGLLAYYPFCGNANDVSGNNYNGVVNGATLSADRFSSASRAYRFNDNSNYINLPTSLTWSNLQGLTFSAWARFTNIVSTAGGDNFVIELTDGPTSNAWPNRYTI